MNDKRYSLSAKFERRCIQIGGFRLEVDGSCATAPSTSKESNMQKQPVGNELPLLEG
jgi:hypothetical protein